MRDLQRDIEEVRALRGDLSNYLVHLTRGQTRNISGKLEWKSAKDHLENILLSDELRPSSGVGQFSHSSYGTIVQKKDIEAVCFTEAPIDQIYLFIGVNNRAKNFSSYGLVFDKEKLAKQPVLAAPVMYFSQPEKKDFYYVDILKQLATKHYSDFKDVLFLFDRFGKQYSGQDYNWRWECEWRARGKISNIKSLLKFCLCEEKDIPYFEGQYPEIAFVDPMFNPEQIKSKLKLRGITI